MLELLVAFRYLPRSLASSEDGKKLADAMTLQLQLEGHARARLVHSVDGHRPDRSNRPSRPAERGLARGLVGCDLVRNIASSTGHLATLQHARAYARRAVRLHVRAHE